MANNKKKNDSLNEKYQKWENESTSLLKQTQAEEEEERQISSLALGHTQDTVYSQAQADDQDKLKHIQDNIQKPLDVQQERELNAIASLEDLLGDGDVVIDEGRIGGKRVLSLLNCTGPGCIVLPSALSSLPMSSTNRNSEEKDALSNIKGIIKIFIENCHNCTIQIKCKILTSTVEISNSTNITVQFSERLSTIQVDLCEDITLNFRNESCFGFGPVNTVNSYGDRIYHAGVRNMSISICGVDGAPIIMETNVDYIRDGAIAQQNATAEEYQFITFVDSSSCNKLITERLVRYKGMALSETEFLRRYENKTTTPVLDQEPPSNEKKSMEEMEDLVKQCYTHKVEGNASFQDGNYAQAVLYYSLAIDKSQGLAPQTNPIHNFTERHICHANRSACFLKLGHHDKALNDADCCMALQPNYIKGTFRKGLALHAMARYKDALPFLVECQRREPKNKQIMQALKFCEVRFEMDYRKRMSRD